ncbi:DUF6252 family protein [Flagellimonas sp. 2504JD1-5]
MKKTVLLTLWLMATLYSCSKSDDSGEDTKTKKGTFEVVLDGIAFSPLQSTMEKVVPSAGEPYILVTAYDDTDSFFIYIYDLKPGTYVLSEISSTRVKYLNFTTGYSSISGSINISEISDSRVKATFEASCLKDISNDATVALTKGIIDITK